MSHYGHTYLGENKLSQLLVVKDDEIGLKQLYFSYHWDWVFIRVQRWIPILYLAQKGITKFFTPSFPINVYVFSLLFHNYTHLFLKFLILFGCRRDKSVLNWSPDLDPTLASYPPLIRDGTCGITSLIAKTLQIPRHFTLFTFQRAAHVSKSKQREGKVNDGRISIHHLTQDKLPLVYLQAPRRVAS